MAPFFNQSIRSCVFFSTIVPRNTLINSIVTLYFLLLQSIELPDVQRLSWRQGRFAVVAVFHLAASKSGGIHTNSNPYHPHFANDYEHLKKINCQLFLRSMYRMPISHRKQSILCQAKLSS